MRSNSTLPFDLRLMRWCTQLCLVAFVLVMMACALLAVGRLPYFSIQTVTLQGELSKTNDNALQQAATSAINGTLFTADLSAVKAALEETPWVRRAVVRRQFPNGLRVELSEHTALALWGDSDDEEGMRMVNTHGEIFEANRADVENDHLVQLQGPDEQVKEVLQMYQQLARPFAAAGQALLGLNLNERGTWSVRTETGARMELGAGVPAQVLSRSQAFFSTFPVISSRLNKPTNALESADLRYPNAYALRLRGLVTNTIASAENAGTSKAQ